MTGAALIRLANRNAAMSRIVAVSLIDKGFRVITSRAVIVRRLSLAVNLFMSFTPFLFCTYSNEKQAITALIESRMFPCPMPLRHFSPHGNLIDDHVNSRQRSYRLLGKLFVEI